MFKKLFLFLFICGALLFFGRDFVVKNLVKVAVSHTTGLKVDMHAMQVDFSRMLVLAEGIILYNPRNFPEPIMANMHELYIDFDARGLLKGMLRFTEIRFSLDKLSIIKNHNGTLNVASLKRSSQKSVEEKGGSSEGEEKKKKAIKLKIDKLDLSVGKVVYKDYSISDNPNPKEINLNMKATLNDISDVASIVNAVMRQVYLKSALSNIGGLDLTTLLGNNLDLATKAENVTQNVANKAKEFFNSFLN